MTWTYSSDPGSSDRDAVRFLIGDTDTDDQQLSNEEIDYTLAENSSIYSAAIASVRAIIALYARLVDKAVGDLKLNYSQRLASYQALKSELKSKVAIRGAPVVGGLSQARKDTVKEDTDRVAPAVERDQFSYPGTETSDEDSDSLSGE